MAEHDVRLRFTASAGSATRASKEVKDALNGVRTATDSLAREQKQASGATEKLSREQQRAAREAREAERSLKSAARGAVAGSGAFSHLGRSIAFASASFLGAAGFIHVIGESIRRAEDLDDRLDTSAVVFGKNSQAMQDWAKGAADSFGLAREQALGFADEIGLRFKGLGFATDQVASFSKQIVQLSRDVGELRHRDPEEFLNAFTAALAGRTRGLKQFGVFIDDATVKARALSMGLVHAKVDTGKLADAQERIQITQAQYNKAVHDYGVNSIAAHQAILKVHGAQAALSKVIGGQVPVLTQQQKAMAIYRETILQTADAHGFYAKQQGDADVQTQRLRAHLQNLEEDIGTALLPTIVKVTQAIADWLSKGKNQERLQKDIADAVKLLQGALSALWEVIKTVKGAFDLFAGAVGGGEKAIKLLIGAMVISKIANYAKAFDGLRGSIGRTTGAIGQEGGRTGLLGGLNRLKSVGRIAIPIALVTQVIDKHGSAFGAAIQGGLMAAMFGAGPAGIAVAAGGTLLLNVLMKIDPTAATNAINQAQSAYEQASGRVVLGTGTQKTIPGATVLQTGQGQYGYYTNDPMSVVKISAKEAAAILGISVQQLAKRVKERAAAGAGVTAGAPQELQAIFAPGADLPGRPTHARPRGFANALSTALGHPVTVGTGTNHSKDVFQDGRDTGRVSEHYAGNAVDIPFPHGDSRYNKAAYAESLQYGRTALILAGAEPAWANQQVGGAWTINGYNILFNTLTGGNHFNHLHVGTGRAKTDVPPGLSRFFSGGVAGNVRPSVGQTTPTTPRTGQQGAPKMAGTRASAPEARSLGGPARARDFNQSACEQLWVSAGGDPAVAKIAGAIAMAECGGHPRSDATNRNKGGSIDYGVWQINSVHGVSAAKLLAADQKVNAQTAVGLYNAAGDFTDWVTYNNLDYEHYMKGGAKTDTGGPPPKPSITAPTPRQALTLSKLPGGPEGIAGLRFTRQILTGRLATRKLGPQEEADLRDAIRDIQGKIDDFYGNIRDAVSEKQKAWREKMVAFFKEHPENAFDFASLISTRGGEMLPPAVLAAIKRGIATAQGQIAEALKPVRTNLRSAKDALKALLGFDQSTVVTTQNELGQDVRTTIGAVAQRVRGAIAQMQEVFAAANKAHTPAAFRAVMAMVKKAASAWESLGPLATNAIQAGVSQTQAALEAAQSQFSNSIGIVQNIIMEAFDRETQAHISAMQAANQAAINAVQQQAQQQIASLQAAAQKRIQGLQEALQKKLKSLQEGLKKQIDALEERRARPTGAEAALSALQEQRAAAAAAEALASARQALADAQSAPDAATPEGQQRIVDAQKALDNVLLDQQEASLQKQAEAERKALDASIQAQEDSLQTKEQAQEEALQKQESAAEEQINKELEARTNAINAETEARVAALSAQEAAAESEYQDERAGQRLLFEQELADHIQHLMDRSETFEQFMDWLRGKNASGIFGQFLNPVIGMFAAGDSQGSAFYKSFTFWLNKAAADYNAFLAAVAAGGAAPTNAGSSSGGPRIGAIGGNVTTGTVPTCFAAGTLIATPTGDLPIEQVMLGDVVWCWDAATARAVPTQVTGVQAHNGERTMRVVFEGGSVRCTRDHLFWTQEGWKPAELLQPGSTRLLRRDGTAALVTSLGYGEREAVYNFHVEHEEHNYFAAGVCVHNKIPMQTGGKVPGTFIGRYDTATARVTPGENVTDRELTQAMESYFLGPGGPRRGGGGATVVIRELHTYGTTPRQVHDGLARGIRPYLGRVSSYQSPI